MSLRNSVDGGGVQSFKDRITSTISRRPGPEVIRKFSDCGGPFLSFDPYRGYLVVNTVNTFKFCVFHMGSKMSEKLLVFYVS